MKKSPLLDNFYLAGGTALALQIGHRKSEDFDWFTEKPLLKNLKSLLEKLFGDSLKPEIKNKEELTSVLWGVKTTFFHYPFKLIYPTIDLNGFKLASIREIALMKAFTLGQRAALKDYVDLYFIFKSGIDINDILKDIKIKYGEKYDIRMFLEQLVYLRDIDRQKISFLQGEISIRQMERYFMSVVKAVKLDKKS